MLSFQHPETQLPIKLGKGHRITDKRTIQLSKYLGAVAPPPVAASFKQKVESWPMFENDTLGCCVIAEMGHAIQQWTEYAGIEKTVKNTNILKAYEDVGGYVPGDPSTDNGCDMLTALRYFRKTGLGGNRIHLFAEVNPRSPVQVKQSVALFGNCDLGLQLPVSAQRQVGKVWAVPKRGPVGQGEPGSWGGHCVPIVAYDANGLYVVTWGAIQFMTWSFLRIYADEAYAVVSQQFVNKEKGTSPSGLDLDQMDADVLLVAA